MSDSFNCINKQPPAYSGVTININNPALNVPQAVRNNLYPQACSSPYVNSAFYPQRNQYSNKMNLHAFAPMGELQAQNGMNLHAFAPTGELQAQNGMNLHAFAPTGELQAQNGMNLHAFVPTRESQVQGNPLQQGQNPNTNPYEYNIYSSDNNEYGISSPYYNPYVNGGEYISPVQNNDYGVQNPAPYQTVYGENNGLMPAYPPQYYINNRTYPNEKTVNLLPDGTQSAEVKENDEEVNTDTSKEIISELDGRRAEEKELEKNGKKTKIVSLTNEYIMSLENYLNNPNTDIRLMAAKEILTRLDEDRSRYDDAALNALLNKMLQDPNKLVRVAAMSAFSSELASGNDYTVQLLNQIQQNPEADPEDVLEASQILLKRAAGTEVRYTKDGNQ